jgi:hypothetical protein
MKPPPRPSLLLAAYPWIQLLLSMAGVDDDYLWILFIYN